MDDIFDGAGDLEHALHLCDKFEIGTLTLADELVVDELIKAGKIKIVAPETNDFARMRMDVLVARGLRTQEDKEEYRGLLLSLRQQAKQFTAA